MLERIWEKRPLIHCWWECKLVQPLWKSAWWFFNKAKNRPTLWPRCTTPLLGIYLKECKSTYKRDICTSMFITALFTIAKHRNHCKCSMTNEWIKKRCVYTHRVLFSKKKEIMPLSGKWMEVEIIELSEICQAQQPKYHVFTHMQNIGLKW
jgi:hypothetical protein